MVLNVRQKQADAIVRMLHFNAVPAVKTMGEEDVYKVLILDRYTKEVLAPLLRVNELRRHGVTLHLLLDSERQPIPDVPAVYFVEPSEAAVQRIVQDAARGLYDSFHLNFSTHLPRPLLEKLAGGLVAAGAAGRLAKLHDQHTQFVSLEGGLFTLGLPDTYLALNDPQAQDTQIEAAVGAVVEGLFCALATLGVVPIIRCPRGGAAEHVASQLDARLREALSAGRGGGPFAEGGSSGGGAGLAASLQRPLLCLFDRTFELSIVLQHTWTYKPLVHDVLGMHLNRITVAEAAAPGHPPARKAYEVDDADFFWNSHGKEQFPKIAEQVEAELARYKADIEAVNRQTGSHIDPAADPNELMKESTRSLMSAVSSLPELTDRKRVIDKHTNLATALLRSIKDRQLDAFYALEEDCIAGKADPAAVLRQLQAPVGSAADKLRLALVWLLTSEAAPSEVECGEVEQQLSAAGADMAAWAYVKRMRRMNLMGKGQPGSTAEGMSSLGGSSTAHLTNLLGTTFGQGLSSLTKGVKNLLAGEQQAAVTVAVESLMDGKPSPDTDAYLIFDPKAPAGRAQRPAGPFKEAVVFMIGGGNYLEAESLSCWASRAQPTPKHIVYGATELLGGEAVLAQLAELGRRSGAAQ